MKVRFQFQMCVSICAQPRGGVNVPLLTKDLYPTPTLKWEGSGCARKMQANHKYICRFIYDAISGIIANYYVCLPHMTERRGLGFVGADQRIRPHVR